MADIVYTYTDEAPLLATYSLFPILENFLARAGVSVELADISLAGRILATFPEYLKDEQKTPDFLKILGEMTADKNANIIKLPNISASLPQLNAAIAELRGKGFMVPQYPAEPKNAEEEAIKARYAKVLGSAVNPVLREGNSDRRCAPAVKAYAKEFPHKNEPWSKDAKTRVAHMEEGDFFANERSLIAQKAGEFEIKFENDGAQTTLKTFKADAGDVISATFLDAAKLDEFIAASINEAKREGLLYSAHLKATMMKVSDPVIFGHFVKVFFAEIFEEFGDELAGLGVNANNGLKDLFARVAGTPLEAKIRAKYEQILAKNPPLAMVNSDEGITNLHVPSDVIIDNSMPNMIRAGGKMWNAKGELQETLAVIPDKTYATIYEAIIEDLKERGALDPARIGSVSNVGLMAKKAEEYGSHDKTFIAETAGKFTITNGAQSMEFTVKKGDIFRAIVAKKVAIDDWIELAVRRAKATGAEAIFWLDEKRAHDANMIKIVREKLSNLNTQGLKISILAPTEAMKRSLDIIREGRDAISVTGNVMRDYLTDLFPIMELGTSAKMLSIVPLLSGGGLFETGAGGSAPKIARQLFDENHLRWDSLGEFLALGASLEHLYSQSGKEGAKILADTLDKAIARYLKNDKSPKKKAGELDNRGSHFYLALYWADELAKSPLGAKFEGVANALKVNETKIVSELSANAGIAADLGGYYKLDAQKAGAVMRPSAIFNDALAK